MSLIEQAIGYSKTIESILETQYGATGRGLHDKLTRVEGRVPPETARKLRFVASVRNKLVHEEGYACDDPEGFLRACRDVIEELKANAPAADPGPSPGPAPPPPDPPRAPPPPLQPAPAAPSPSSLSRLGYRPVFSPVLAVIALYLAAGFAFWGTSFRPWNPDTVVARSGGRGSTRQAPDPNRPPDLQSDTVLSVNGMGPIRVGMRLREAEQSLRARLAATGGAPNQRCYYVAMENGPPGVAFMVVKGVIARVDVEAPATNPTKAGARIGSSEAEIERLYPGRIEATPSEYSPGGRYLRWKPEAAKFRNFGIVFETDGQQVTRMRAGRLPELNYVESCS